MIPTRKEGGFLWPANDEAGAVSILRHASRHFPVALSYVPGRRIAVQAGGNVGVYPTHLAKHFAQVFTFEPDAANFACLEQNLNGIANVISRNCALGSSPDRTVGLDRHPLNVGAYRLTDDGDIPVVTLDGLDLQACDLIWLDVEGSELDVLKGATNLLARSRPVVIVEDMAIGHEEGIARRWLQDLGYVEKAKLLNDYVMVPR